MATTSRSRRSRKRRTGGRGKAAGQSENIRAAAAWENFDDDGEFTHISVVFNESVSFEEGDRMTLFVNDYKEEDKHPDFNGVVFPK